MTRTPLAALALVAALACAGCNDDDPRPDFAPPESTSPAPTPTGTTSDPPEVLGPEETVRAWVEARNQAMATGDASALRELSAPECSSCKEQIEPIEQVYAHGGHFETSGWRVKKAKVNVHSERGAEVSTALVLAGGRTVPSQGAAPVEYPPEKRIAVFELVQSEGRWLINLIGFLR